jgi:glycosyltransferase involved in cell wall biosynthesis
MHDPEADYVFHLLSFEGPDPYARAGGIATRITGLAKALAGLGFETHLWFVGDPALPGHATHDGVSLHRWCQWISANTPQGVYDGEVAKEADYASSLPPFLFESMRLHLSKGGRAAILAEEWHTVHAVLHLDWLLRTAGLRQQVDILWNANNTFGFERIDWARLSDAATVTTVSRYMRHRMWDLGVDAMVVPNGIPPEAVRPPTPVAVRSFRAGLGNRIVLSKVARWDPDKRWLLAVETIAALRHSGCHPLLIARGGKESHAQEVLARAAALGLRTERRVMKTEGARGLIHTVSAPSHQADVLLLDSPLDREACRLLFGGSSAVLANSGHEPFGLVGLETMGAGGVACTGGTGEDYAVAGWNSLMLQTVDPLEFVRQFRRLQADPEEERLLRRNGLATAERFTWPGIVRRNLLPLLGIRVASETQGSLPSPTLRHPRSRDARVLRPDAGRHRRSERSAPRPREPASS